MDPLECSYAILGLRRGCTSAELKRTYRQLVKRWHPDRYAGDPTGQAEASSRLREINVAFRLVAQELTGVVGRAYRPAEAEPPARPGEPDREPGRPLTRSEIDAIVGALGSEGPIHVLLEWASLMWPLAVALLLLLQPRGSRPASTVEAILGVGLIVLGIVLLVRKRVLSGREGRPAARSVDEETR